MQVLDRTDPHKASLASTGVLPPKCAAFGVSHAGEVLSLLETQKELKPRARALSCSGFWGQDVIQVRIHLHHLSLGLIFQESSSPLGKEFLLDQGDTGDT